MTTKKEKIIKEWNKLKLVHPTYKEIAAKVDCDQTYVFKVIQELKNKSK